METNNETLTKLTLLPDELSELITVALDDLEKVERDETYTVYMSIWHGKHLGRDTNPCSVCLAGAVMAKTLGARPDNDLIPTDFPSDIARKLYVIDYARTGCFETAADLLNPGSSELVPDMPSIPSYGRFPEEFKTQMREAVEILRQHGL